MGEKKNVPELRFEGFCELWEKKKISNVAPLQRGFDLPVTQMEEGPYPVVMSNGIGGWHSQYKAKGPGVVTGRSGTIGRIHYVDNNFWPHNTSLWVTDFCGNYPMFVYYLYHQLDLASYGTGSGVPTLNRNDVHDTKVAIPSYEEQKYLSWLFSRLDHLLTLQQRKCERLKNIKKSMLEKMFPREGSDVPEIRFEGFSGAWERKKLGDIMNVTSVKRIHQSDWTDSGVRFLRARDIVAAAKGETPDDLLYISKEKYEEYSLLSGKVAVDDLLVTGVGTIGVPYLIRNSEPLYFKDGNIIWFQNEGRINGDFLYYSFVGKQIQAFIKDSAGIGTVGTYTIDSGKKTPIQLTNSIEQKRIGSYFSHLDRLITLHQQKYEKLKQIKQSLLEKMFV